MKHSDYKCMKKTHLCITWSLLKIVKNSIFFQSNFSRVIPLLSRAIYGNSAWNYLWNSCMIYLRHFISIQLVLEKLAKYYYVESIQMLSTQLQWSSMGTQKASLG